MIVDKSLRVAAFLLMMASARNVLSVEYVDVTFHDGTDYQNILLLRTDLGARWSHQQQGGWDGQGAARFYPPDARINTEASYSGVTLEGYKQPTDEIYARWIVRWGPTYFSGMRPYNPSTSKMFIVHRDGGASGTRLMMLYREGSAGTYLYIDNNIERPSYGSTANANYPVLWVNGLTEWLCFQVHASNTAGTYTMTITDRQGNVRFTDTVPLSFRAPPFGWVTMAYTAAADVGVGTWYEMSDLVVANTAQETAIPSGFITGSSQLPGPGSTLQILRTAP